MTNLECVNEVLRTVGINSVSAVETSGASDAAEAWRHLESASREIQELGWAYNRFKDVELTPDGDDHILIPANVYSDSIDSCGASASINVVPYGDRLRDADDPDPATYDEFDSSITVEYIKWFELCSVPEAIQRYICMAASVNMAEYLQTRSRRAPSPELLRRRMYVARSRALRSDGAITDQNLSRDADGVRFIGRPQDGSWAYPGGSRIVL